MTPPTDEQKLAMDEYLGRVQALVIEQTWLSPQEFHEVWHLIDRGEPAEGLSALAWMIAENERRVPRRVIDDIRRYTEGLLDPGDLPPGLTTGPTTSSSGADGERG